MGEDSAGGVEYANDSNNSSSANDFDNRDNDPNDSEESRSTALGVETTEHNPNINPDPDVSRLKDLNGITNINDLVTINPKHSDGSTCNSHDNQVIQEVVESKSDNTSVAQLVERLTVNQKDVGSIPTGGAKRSVVQTEEHLTLTQEVTGSNPVRPSNYSDWRNVKLDSKFVPKKWGEETTADKVLDDYNELYQLTTTDQDIDCPDACDVDHGKEFIAPVVSLGDLANLSPLEVNVETLVPLTALGYNNKSLELYAKILDDRRKLAESCETNYSKQGSGFAEDLLTYFRKCLIDHGREPYLGREMEIFERICSEIPNKFDRTTAIDEFCECSSRTEWYTNGNNEFAGHGYGAKSLIYLCDRIWFKEAKDKEVERVASIERRKSQDLYHYSNNILAWNDLNDSVKWFKDKYGDDAKNVITKIIIDNGKDLKNYSSIMGVLEGVPIKPATREECREIGMQFEFYRDHIANKSKTKR